MLSLLTHSKPQDRGEVSEWFKEAVLKTVEQQCSVGSNPTFSAIILIVFQLEKYPSTAEGAPLLRE